MAINLAHRYSRDNLSAEAGQLFVSDGREYRMEGRLADGAIGVVRKARDLESNQVVAVKFLAPEFRYIEESGIDDIYARFRREGVRGSGLEHENLVRVLSYEDNENGTSFKDKGGPANPFLVMEMIHGKTLESLSRDKVLTPV